MGHPALTGRLTLGNKWPQVKAFFIGRFMNYYSHHIGDFDRATRHLTRIERSVYLDLMFTYYDTEQPLTPDVAALCRKIVARTEEEKAAVIAVLDEFFVSTPNGWFHDRCEEELAKFRETKSQASAAGKVSALKRAERRHAALNGIPTDAERRGNGNPTTVERPLNDRSTEAQQTLNRESTNQYPISTIQEPKATKVKSNVPPSGETAEVFAYWQRAMAHPQAKLDAKRERNIKARLKDGYTVEQLCKAVDGCKLSPHHMGQNDTRTVYDDIELICRDGPRVDKFIALVERGGGMAMSPGLRQQVDVLQTWLEKQED